MDDDLSCSDRHEQSEGEEEDYLSNLPVDLLRHILSFLPTIDSIRTSVLARRWRHVWTSVPVIDFPYLQLQSGVIDRFVASRGGGNSVSRLHVTVYGVDCEVYNLVKYAKTHNARHMTLGKFFERHCHSLSLFDLVFDWPSLVSLDLQVGNNSTFSKCIVRLSNLKTLSLQLIGGCFHKESLANLLSGCPVLEELTLNALTFLNDDLVRIEAPNLLRLTLYTTPSNFQINCQKLKYLSLHPGFNVKYLHVEAPSLISIQLYKIWRFETFAKTLCDVTTVAITVSEKCLSDSKTRSFLEQYMAIVQGFPIFHKLLELEIKMYVAEKFSLDMVFDLLRCTPNLQSLILTACKKLPPSHVNFDEWEKSLSSRINEPLEHLERVSVNIKGKKIRSVFLKTLSQRVPLWDRVAVSC